MSWYDTREGITAAVKKGIAGLHELSKARHAAGYDRKEHLQQWCVIGLYTLDTCGNFSEIIENAPRNRRRQIEIKDVMTHEEAFKTILGEWTSTPRELPPVVGTCDRCLHGWDMLNIDDHHSRQFATDPHRHESCNTLAIFQQQLESFTEILAQSEMPHVAIAAIPNEYHPASYKNPWFMVTTKWGPLRLGWRRSVIEITWHNSQINHNGDLTFKEENVTTGRTMVHAWGTDKAVEYLNKLSKGNFSD